MSSLRSRSSSASGARRRTTASPSPSPARRSMMAPARAAVAPRQPRVGAFGQPGDRAVDAAGLPVGGERQRVVRRRFCQSSSSAVDSSGSAPGSSSTSATSASTSSGSTCRPTRAAGSSIGPAQLRGLHRTDEDVVGAQQLGQLREGGAAAVEVGPHRDDHDGPLAAGRGRPRRARRRRRRAPARSGRR